MKLGFYAKKSKKLNVQFDVDDDSSDGENESPMLMMLRRRKNKSPPPKYSGVNIHQGFQEFGFEGHSADEVEAIRKRRLDELFINVKMLRTRNDTYRRRMTRLF